MMRNEAWIWGRVMMRNEAWIWWRVMMGSRIPGPRGVTNRGPTTWLIGKKLLWAGAAPGPVPGRGAGPRS